MRLFRRTADVMSASLHDFVQRFERPDRMLRHSLREMELLVEATTAAVARSIAAERLLVKTRAAEQDEVKRWTDRAAAAVAAHDDALARRAIERRFEHERTLALLARQLAEAAETNTALRRQLEVLRAKYAAAESRTRSLTARQAVADVRRTTAFAAGKSPQRVLAQLERWSRAVECVETETVVLAELEMDGDVPLEQEFDRRASAEAVEAELARLKQVGA
ncbi:MAG TPA: PspA/IM30 family protein [Pirellulales bacterium]|jgi:phage shock protein A|nr:PspA/IM30 family protein [Pirellulales bacterium]